MFGVSCQVVMSRCAFNPGCICWLVLIAIFGLRWTFASVTIWKSGGPWGLGVERSDNNIHLQMIVGSGHSIHISKYKVQGWWPLGAMELQLQAMVTLFCIQLFLMFSNILEVPT